MQQMLFIDDDMWIIYTKLKNHQDNLGDQNIFVWTAKRITITIAQ